MDTELFFPEGTPTREARRACASCPVVSQCLEYALDWGVIGIWGGTTMRERRKILRDRNEGLLLPGPGQPADPVLLLRGPDDIHGRGGDEGMPGLRGDGTALAG
jgi:hypothetical protein